MVRADSKTSHHRSPKKAIYADEHEENDLYRSRFTLPETSNSQPETYRTTNTNGDKEKGKVNGIPSAEAVCKQAGGCNKT
jgi:hypothetical protein